jgi:polysaccharide export outer membrane protein
MRRLVILSALAAAMIGAPAADVAAQSTALLKPAPRPGDVVRMRIWREPDMSGDYAVNESGDVVLPKLGHLHIGDMSADSLRRRLVSAYSEFLRDPAVDITVLRRVKVTGAVKNPGLYPADATMTLGDVVALAGGATPEGDDRKVKLTRAGDAQSVELSFDQRIAESPVRSGDQLEVIERPWYARNTGIVATAVSTAGFVIVTLIKR